MATSLFSTLLAVLIQTPPPAPPAAPPPAPAVAPLPADSSRAALWARVGADSTDAGAWLLLGRGSLLTASGHDGPRAQPAADSTAVRAMLDTAEYALARAVQWAGTGTSTADSARVFRVFAYGERAFHEWKAAGVEAATAAWHKVPGTLRLPPVLEELGENLLRACPRDGILFTADEVDTHTAWLLRFVRGLRADLVVVPFARWRADSVFRRRVLRELREPVGALSALAEGRALCASMGFERPPEVRPEVRWNTRPLVWVAGREGRADRVPARDFVFAALRQAVERRDPWSAPAIALYRRAASNVSDLCQPLRTFGLRSEVGCR